VGAVGTVDPAAASSITFVVPIAAVGAPQWTALRQSLASQSNPSWEVVLVLRGDGPEDPTVDGVGTVVVVDEGATLGEAMKAGLDAATSDAVAFLGPWAVLAPDAVDSLLGAMGAGADVAYSDERIGEAVFRKPAFSPERLRSQFYWGDVTAYRRAFVHEVGGVRTDIDGAELYELALRAARAARSVAHVAEVLSTGDGRSLSASWGIEDVVGDASIANVLEEHLSATGGGVVEAVGRDGLHRTRRVVQGEPLVSIIIPTRGDSASVHGAERCLVVEAVRSVVELSTYTNFEIVIVVDTVAPEPVREQLREVGGERLRLVEWDKPFSFAGKMNFGALHARGEFLLLLNDDVEVITPQWIEPMLALAQRPHAGFAGAMLYFEDETIQHAGHAYYRGDVTHIGLNSPRGAPGPWGAFEMEREVAGVTGACSVIRTSVFIEAGGFSPLLPGNFNDVDLCMKLSVLGYQSYWTPFSELFHFESKSRNPRVARSEIQTAWGRWEHHFWDSPWWPTDPHEIYPAHAGRAS